MSRPTKYARSGATITQLATEHDPAVSKTYGSKNDAKKESRRLQLQADGALGRGSLMIK